jgi:hypothetical protein
VLAKALPALPSNARGTPAAQHARREHVNALAAGRECRRVDAEALPGSANVDALTPKRCRQGSIGHESCVEACRIRPNVDESCVEG